MRVLLLSTYDLGRQPFGLASPAAWLRGRGHQVACADLSVDSLPDEAVRQAEFIGFHLPMHTATRLVAGLVPQVRHLNPDAPLCAYGLYAPLNAEYLRSLGFQAIIGGEFEAALLRAVEGESPGALVQLDRLTFQVPDRRQLRPLSRYAKLRTADGPKTVGSTEASRGCKHLCRHCPVVPVYGGQFRIVQAEVVLADIRQQVEAGAEHITFSDPDFLNGPTHAVRIVEALHHEFPRVTYDATVKVEHLLKHQALLPTLKRTGCLFIVSAVESLQDDVLASLEKGHTRQDFLTAVALCRETGIALSPTFIPFTPWTTPDSYRDLLDTLADLDLAESVSPVQLALRLLIPSGSRMLELPEVQRVITGYDGAALLHRWRHDNPAVDRLAADVLKLVDAEQKQKRTRGEIFSQIATLVGAARPPREYGLMPRATVPYLDEPWYC